MPEAYITATRQYVAQAQNHSLEELSLRVRITERSGSVSLDEKTFAVSGKTNSINCNTAGLCYRFLLLN